MGRQLYRNALMITDLVGDGRIQESRSTASNFIDINGDGRFDLVAGSD